MTAWVSVPKPTGQNWTDVQKPSESSIVVLGGPVGQPIGLLLALTYSGEITSVLTGWAGITKPTSSVWTLVNKPTT